MLKFFQQIRQKLLDEGNLRRYLVYATGEVFLVVIGILIALQINNWNEKRKLHEQERSYLERLVSDLESDVRLTQIRIQSNREDIVFGQYLDSVYRGAIEVQDPVYFVFALQQIGRNYTDMITTSTFDDLVSTGNMNSIRDQELRIKIKNYYQEIPFKFINQHYERGQDLLDIAIEVLPLPYLEKTLRGRGGTDVFEVTYTELQTILNLLEKKESYPFHLKNVIRSNMLINQLLKKILQDAEALRTEIESYLKIDID